MRRGRYVLTYQALTDLVEDHLPDDAMVLGIHASNMNRNIYIEFGSRNAPEIQDGCEAPVLNASFIEIDQ